jgi:hypothetical protein
VKRAALTRHDRFAQEAHRVLRQQRVAGFAARIGEIRHDTRYDLANRLGLIGRQQLQPLDAEIVLEQNGGSLFCDAALAAR